MVIQLFWTVSGLFGCGAMLILLEHRLHRPVASRRRADWVKYGIYATIIIGLLTAASLSRCFTAILLSVIALGSAFEIYRNAGGRHRAALSGLCFAGFCLALGHLLLGAVPPWIVSFGLAVVFVATTDAFCQLWGKCIGRHRLCPRLSPGKTVEGLFGGLVTTALLGVFLGGLFSHRTSIRLLVLAVLTALGAVVGDLLFSAVKRSKGIKDFSGILPGHGGILDRFDSLIVAAPVYYWSSVLLGL